MNFTFDNAGQDFALLGRDVENGAPVACYSLADPLKYFTASLCRGRAVYVTADALSAQRAAQSIGALSDKRVALLSAKDEVLFYRKALSKDALFRRLNALYEWQSGADIIVGDIEAFMQLVPERLKSFRLTVGKETEMRTLVSSLVAAGYSREYTAEAKGAFAVRGDVLDIFPVNADHPVRVDFFGDEVESIKPYDEITGERYWRKSCRRGKSCKSCIR